MKVNSKTYKLLQHIKDGAMLTPDEAKELYGIKHLQLKTLKIKIKYNLDIAIRCDDISPWVALKEGDSKTQERIEELLRGAK